MSADAERSPARRRAARKMAASTSRGGAPAQERKLRSQGRETLRKLLEAGMVVFDRRGYHAARVDDIVKVAKTSHGTFYLYFANKEDLFWALLSDVSEEMTALSASLGPISPGRKGYEELRNWLEQFVDLYTRYGPVIRAWTETETGTTEAGTFGAGVLARFARRLSDPIVEANPGPGLHADVAALAMVAMIERLTYYVLTQSVEIDREQLLDTLTAILHVGVFAGTRGRRSAAAV